MKIFKCNEADRDYKSVCEFVQNEFLKKYNAKITSFAKNFFYIKEREQIIATVGVRLGSNEVLFSQIYFEHPIENVISNLTKKMILKKDIIEFSNLTSVKNYYSVYVMKKALENFQEKYILFTGTEQLINVFTKKGYSIIKIKKSEKFNEDWGTYYSFNPYVCLLNPKKQNKP